MPRRYRDYNPMDTEEDDYEEYELQRRINEHYNRQSNGGGIGGLMFILMGIVAVVWGMGFNITSSNRPIQVVPNPGLTTGPEYYERTRGGTVQVSPDDTSPPVGWSGSESVTPQQYGAMGRGGMYRDNEESPCIGRGC